MAEDTVSQQDAWRIYERLSRDHRIFYSPEQPELETTWKQYSLSALSGINLWTDAYLAAFAKVRSWRLVSFDKGFQRLKASEFEATILK
jgi:predicted nucleic acid-binding protein